jgi:predicted alpha/beta superfamily hydrolase
MNRKILIWAGTLFLLAFVVFVFSPSSKKSLRIESEILEECRKILFRLPQDYKGSDISYPVLYHLDAAKRISHFGPSFYTIADRVEAMASEGIPQMIVIGIPNTNRDRDMIPAETEYHPQGGGTGDFLAFITQELIPFVDKKFRTSKERVLYGRSDSGLFALYALLENPRAFSAVISASPTVGLFPLLIRTRTREMFDEHPHLTNKLYISYGSDDIPYARDHIPSIVQTIQDYKNPEFRFAVKIIAGGGHIPKSSLYDGLKFMFKKGSF